MIKIKINLKPHLIKPTTFVLLCAIVFLSTGCESTVKLKIPQNRFFLPETNGESKFNLRADYAAEKYRVVLSDNISSDPVNTRTPKVTKSDSEYGVSLDYGINDRFDIGVSANSNTALNVKWMLQGEPRKSSKEGNISTALTFSYGRQDSSGDDSSIFGPGDDSFDVNSDVFDAGIVSGYRSSDNLLIYGGLFATRYDYKVTVKRQQTVQSRQNFTNNVDITGINAGFDYRWNNNASVVFEVVHSFLSADQTDKDENFFGGGLNVMF